jgi:hypothetical protein
VWPVLCCNIKWRVRKKRTTMTACMPIVCDFGLAHAAAHLPAQAVTLSARLQAQHAPCFGAVPALPPSQRTATWQPYRCVCHAPANSVD